jgi:hypothetical protein
MRYETQVATTNWLAIVWLLALALLAVAVAMEWRNVGRGSLGRWLLRFVVSMVIATGLLALWEYGGRPHFLGWRLLFWGINEYYPKIAEGVSRAGRC